jgi:threonine/homoserine/homoserine lactone efflux protein
MQILRRRLDLLHRQAHRDRFIASGKWFNRITGAALVGFGFRLALTRAAD